jgi:hypothetical protein
MIKLEPIASASGGGSAEFELSYKRMDNTEGKNIKVRSDPWSAPSAFCSDRFCMCKVGVACAASANV